MVLIVDDHDITREALALIMQGEGYGVLLAAHGEEALNLLRCSQSPPDLIVLDMLMPRLDGWRFLDLKRREPALAPIPVLITTAVGVGSRGWGVSLGAAGFFHKPIDVEPFMEEVRRCLNRGQPVENSG
jgi:CheY-like chemotaxis protein